MNPVDLKNFMNTVLDVFPVPRENNFKGTHSITMSPETRSLELGIWHLCPDGEIRNFPVYFDDSDALVGKKDLQKIKGQILLMAQKYPKEIHASIVEYESGKPTKAPRDEHDQPLPTPNDYPAIQELVIQDIKERMEVGIKRYGSALKPFNGRSALLDLYQELLDGAMYARQRLEEEQLSQAGKLNS